MITTGDKTIAPTIDGSVGIGASITSSTSISISGSGNTATTSRPVANMDETDWTTMLMEMRILNA